jgi:hypothetical protein
MVLSDTFIPYSFTISWRGSAYWSKWPVIHFTISSTFSSNIIGGLPFLFGGCQSESHPWAVLQAVPTLWAASL